MPRGLSDRGPLYFLFILPALRTALCLLGSSRSDLFTALGRDVHGHTAGCKSCRYGAEVRRRWALRGACTTDVLLLPWRLWENKCVVLREGDRTEESFATENEGEMLIRAPAHVHPAHATPCCWSTAFSSFPARSANWLDGPCLASCSMYTGSNS